MYAYEAGNGYAEVSAPSIIYEILLENPELCNSCGLRGIGFFFFLIRDFVGIIQKGFFLNFFVMPLV